jgi:hypothetical protein
VYAGHLAIGMALQARAPKTPAWAIFLGVVWLDLLDGLLVIAGWNQVRPDLAARPYLFFDLVFIDWDHSLAMAALWSLVWAALFVPRLRVVAVAFAAAASHFVADWLVHDGDLALYPHASRHLGLGLWGRLGTWAWLLEGLFCLALCAYAWRRWSQRGVSVRAACTVVAFAFVSLSPWTSALRYVAELPEPWVQRVEGALEAIGALVPALLLTWLLNGASAPRPTESPPPAR